MKGSVHFVNCSWVNKTLLVMLFCSLACAILFLNSIRILTYINIARAFLFLYENHFHYHCETPVSLIFTVRGILRYEEG